MISNENDKIEYGNIISEWLLEVSPEESPRARVTAVDNVLNAVSLTVALRYGRYLVGMQLPADAHSGTVKEVFVKTIAGAGLAGIIQIVQEALLTPQQTLADRQSAASVWAGAPAAPTPDVPAYTTTGTAWVNSSAIEILPDPVEAEPIRLAPDAFETAYADMPVAALRQLAEERGITLIGDDGEEIVLAKAKKADLISALEVDDSDREGQ